MGTAMDARVATATVIMVITVATVTMPRATMEEKTTIQLRNKL
jgi:hypothetical protein